MQHERRILPHYKSGTLLTSMRFWKNASQGLGQKLSSMGSYLVGDAGPALGVAPVEGAAVAAELLEALDQAAARAHLAVLCALRRQRGALLAPPPLLGCRARFALQQRCSQLSLWR